MKDFKQQLVQILKDIDEKLLEVENKDEILKDIMNIVYLCYDEFDKIAEKYDSKIDYITNKQKVLYDRIEELEHSMQDIIQDIYDDYQEEELEVLCPYCNNEFEVDIASCKNQEIKCPECKNTIELFFDDEENCSSCSGSCSSCDCHHDEENDEY